MIPAYPLVYLYPHWETWEEELKHCWNWNSIIEVFCTKHASVVDSRRIPGFNGLTSLGEDRNGYVMIDEEQFRSYLAHLLADQPISSKTFLLAVHYAYALCHDEDITKKKVLIYHVHEPEYVTRYLVKDFPKLKTIAMGRDPRPNVERRFNRSYTNADDEKLNRTDALIYRRRAIYHSCQHVFEGLSGMRVLPANSVVIIKHEDLVSRLEPTMRAVADFLEIEYVPEMLEVTFNGEAWWGDAMPDTEPMNHVNPAIVSQSLRLQGRLIGVHPLGYVFATRPRCRDRCPGIDRRDQS